MRRKFRVGFGKGVYVDKKVKIRRKGRMTVIEDNKDEDVISYVMLTSDRDNRDDSKEVWEGSLGQILDMERMGRMHTVQRIKMVA